MKLIVKNSLISCPHYCSKDKQINKPVKPLRDRNLFEEFNSWQFQNQSLWTWHIAGLHLCFWQPSTVVTLRLITLFYETIGRSWWWPATLSLPTPCFLHLLCVLAWNVVHFPTARLMQNHVSVVEFRQIYSPLFTVYRLFHQVPLTNWHICGLQGFCGMI